MTSKTPPTLEQLLDAFDKAAANLTKLDAIWEQALPHLPDGPSRGSSVEYDDLARNWAEILPYLPPIDGWRVTEELPDIDAAGQGFLDLAELGEPPFGLLAELQAPGRQLADYRFRLNRARRQAVQRRVQEIVTTIDESLPKIMSAVAEVTNSSTRYDSDLTAVVRDGFREADRLVGDTTERPQAWNNMARHLHFSEPHDWDDIKSNDWPDVRASLETMGISELDPIPVDTSLDLGMAAAARPTGSVSTDLRWSALDDDGFERVLYDVLRDLDGYQNVQWLMKTRAPDRGRDLSLERVTHDASGITRQERVIVQAKHWTTKSVTPAAVQESLASLSTWEPPVVRTLIIATSGRFTADAVAVVERHNDAGNRPHVEMWPDSRLESLLAQRPDIVAEHRLRG